MVTQDLPFGCEKCSIAAAREISPCLRREIALFESSHEDYSLAKCIHCGQNYLSHFYEIIDWGGGNDSMWNHWMPLTEIEAAGVKLRYPEPVRSAADTGELRMLLNTRVGLTYGPGGDYFLSQVRY